MSPRWEHLDAPPPAPADGFLMNARMTPNRSLSRRAFGWLFACFAIVNALVAAVFVAQGAYPVAGFLALDVALFAGAFAVNYRAGDVAELVQVSRASVHVAHLPRRGPAAHWVVNPIWLRVRPHPKAVDLAAGDRTVRVGAFLSPPERRTFAAALEEALRRARVSP
jgi:uncharacterized membrane protein